MNVLTVCMANVNRSPTVQEFLKEKKPDWNVKSTGTFSAFAPNESLSQELVDWANVIICMDLEQVRHIFKWFKCNEDKVVCLGVSDQYERDDPELYMLLDWAWKNNYFGGRCIHHLTRPPE
jgi:predicted protein tyrosine phosphatase